MIQHLTSHQLQEAALTLFLEFGLDAISVDDLTHAAGLAPGGGPRQVQREEVVEVLIAPLAQQLTAALEAIAERLPLAEGTGARAIAFELLAMNLSQVFAEHAGALRLYLQENGGPAEGARRPITELREEIFAHATQAADGHCSPLAVEALIATTERVLRAALQANTAPEALCADLVVVFEALMAEEDELEVVQGTLLASADAA